VPLRAAGGVLPRGTALSALVVLELALQKWAMVVENIAASEASSTRRGSKRPAVKSRREPLRANLPPQPEVAAESSGRDISISNGGTCGGGLSGVSISDGGRARGRVEAPGRRRHAQTASIRRASCATRYTFQRRDAAAHRASSSASRTRVVSSRSSPTPRCPPCCTSRSSGSTLRCRPVCLNAARSSAAASSKRRDADECLAGGGFGRQRARYMSSLVPTASSRGLAAEDC
jgi:hypothetical protein